MIGNTLHVLTFLDQVKVHLYNHPAYDPNAPLPTTPEESLEYRLWEDFAKSGILLAPGWFFGTDPDATLIHEIVETARLPTGDQYRALSEGGKYGHLRISFSSPTVSAAHLFLRNGGAYELGSSFYPCRKEISQLG